MYKNYNNKKPQYKFKDIVKRICVLFAIFISVAFLIFGIPIIINEVYKTNSGYLTLWDAADVLSFYAEILSGLIAICALITTIYYSKKDTEKQLKFSQAQTKTPFFIIDNIYQDNNKEIFNKNSNQEWERDYLITQYKKNSLRAMIKLKNIGDGIAINPSYQVDILQDETNDNCNVICKDDFYVLIYNLQLVLERYNDLQENLKNQREFNTSITLKYQNTLGIDFLQVITVKHISKSDTKLSLTIADASSQCVEI